MPFVATKIPTPEESEAIAIMFAGVNSESSETEPIYLTADGSPLVAEEIRPTLEQLEALEVLFEK